MKSVSIYALRDNLAEYLTQVSQKDVSIIVSRFNKPIAMLVPYSEDSLPSPDRFFGFLGKGESGDALVSRVRRSKKERLRTKAFRSRGG